MEVQIRSQEMHDFAGIYGATVRAFSDGFGAAFLPSETLYIAAVSLLGSSFDDEGLVWFCRCIRSLTSRRLFLGEEGKEIPLPPYNPEAKESSLFFSSLDVFFALFGFYLFVKETRRLGYIYLLIGLMQFVTIILTTSRGGALFGVLELVITVLVTIIVLDKKRRKEYLVFAVIVLAIAGAGFGLLYNKIISFIKYIFADGMNDSGRFELYREAIACFFEYPIFGVGYGYAGSWHAMTNFMGVYMFHDTILQFVACLGIVGFTAFAYFYFARMEILFEVKTEYSLFMLMVFIGFEGYSLLDPGTIEGYPACVIMMILYTAHEIDTKQVESRIYRKLINRLKERHALIKKKEVV